MPLPLLLLMGTSEMTKDLPMTSSQLVTTTFASVSIALDLIDSGHIDSAVAVLKDVQTATAKYHSARDAAHAKRE